MIPTQGSGDTTKKRLVVLVSGNGSNLQAIIDACKNGNLPAKIMVVISNKKLAYALTRARENQIQDIYHPYDKNLSREEYDTGLAETVKSFNPDFIILAGWMRILSNAFLSSFSNQVINLHPALPGKYPGTNAIQRAFNDYQAGLITQTGVMVHYVPDESVDNGPLIAKTIVKIKADDTLECLEERIHDTEHKLLVDAIIKLCN